MGAQLQVLLSEHLMEETMMKSLILLFLVFAATNAISLNTLQGVIQGWQSSSTQETDNEITLREYLENLPKPHPLFVNDRGEDDGGEECEAICIHPKNVNGTLNKKCATGRWSPNYEEKGGCNCLTEYKCCNGVCPKVDPNSCFGKNNATKGLQWGALMKD